MAGLKSMTSDSNALAKYNADDKVADVQFNIASNQNNNDVELTKLLGKFDADVLAILKIEKDTGRLNEDGRVRMNIRERIHHIILMAEMQMSAESRAVLQSTFGLKLLNLNEHILAKESFENAIVLSRTITERQRLEQVHRTILQSLSVTTKD